MRVLLTCASFAATYGGPAVSVPSLAQALAELGAEVSLWAPDSSATDAISLAPSCRLLTSSALPSLADIDLLHDNGIWLPYNHRLAKLARQTGTHRIVSIRGMLTPWAVNYKKWRKKLAWNLFQRADLANASALHATAAEEAEDIDRQLPNANVFVIRNGIALPEAIADRLSDPPKLVYLGRIHEKKGLTMLLDAWGKLRPDDWELVIAGNDENNHTETLRQKCRQLGLDNQVSFPGPLYGKDKDDFYRSADLFILPSFSENFGMTVAEALSYGVPVITTDQTPWQHLEEGACGWVTSATVDSITRTLQSALLTSREERQAMGKRGRRLIEAQYQWGAIARAMLEQYEAVLTK